MIYAQKLNENDFVLHGTVHMTAEKVRLRLIRIVSQIASVWPAGEWLQRIELLELRVRGLGGLTWRRLLQWGQPPHLENSNLARPAGTVWHYICVTTRSNANVGWGALRLQLRPPRAPTLTHKHTVIQRYASPREVHLSVFLPCAAELMAGMCERLAHTRCPPHYTQRCYVRVTVCCQS